MIMDAETLRIIMINTLGESVLIETLKAASFFVTHSSSHERKDRECRLNFLESKECYFFVQGTGLDLLIQRFSLLYDADTVRDNFNYYVRHFS